LRRRIANFRFEISKRWGQEYEDEQEARGKEARQTGEEAG